MAILLALISSPAAFARDEGHGPKNKEHSRFELKLENGIQINGDQEFEIMGEITAVVGNNFVVAGQTIFIDPAQVSEFEQKGILVEGERVKVEGVLKNGVKFAEEINVIGTGQGRFQFKVEEKPISLGTTAISNVQIKVKTQGAVQEVISFLEQILTFLTGFIS